MDKILLFIPCYNCEKQIVRVLGQLDATVLAYLSKIIVVNNRSTDKTEEVVQKYLKSHQQLPVALLRNDDNYVLGGSHKVAFNYALENHYDYVIVLHGDDQGDIHDLLHILKNRTYTNYDCCLGARFIKGGKHDGYSLLRTGANHAFNIWFSIFCGKKLYDLGSGLNMYHVKILENCFYLQFPDKLYFNPVMLLASNYYQHKINFFPITWREDDQVSNAKLFGMGFIYLALPLKYRLNRKKFIMSEMRQTIIPSYTYTVIEDNSVAP